MKKKSIKLFLSMVLAGTMVFGLSLSAFAANAVINEDSIRIRSEASTNGEVVETGTKGSKFEIIEEVSAGDGFTWYKIKVNDSKTGYVRGDLVKVEQTENTATSNAPTTANAMAETYATINGTSSVNIRSGAGTGYAKVGALDGGTTLILMGEADDSSGNKWYQMRCEEKGVEGYIRSDFVTLGEPVVPPEEAVEGEGIEGEEMPEEPVEVEPVEPEHNDYEIVYTEDDSGLSTYYMYDHVNNTRQKVSDIFNAISTLNENYEEAANDLSTYKILAIVFGGLAVIFLILMVVFMLKARNGEDDYYYDYDDDEDEDEEEDEAPRRSRVARSSSADSTQAASRQGMQRQGTASAQGSASRQGTAPRQGTSSRVSASSQNGYAQRKPASESTDSQHRPRRSQNFLTDDDEFEFEFLNMDDKD